MKKISLFLSCIITFSYSSFGQFVYIDFEDPNAFYSLFIDTNSNPNNTWQIGQPDKPLFNGAHSPTHVIVTDSLTPYPINDTSSFIITLKRGWEGYNSLLLLDFYFKMDSDTLTDVGMIEFSTDMGTTWNDVMTLDSSCIIWLEPKPALTGSIVNWTHFSVDLRGITGQYGLSDTLLYKFTFISDNIQTNKEGWMIDDLSLEDLWTGLVETGNDNLISIHPNPVSNYLVVEGKNNDDDKIIEIMDFSGKTVSSYQNFNGETIDVGSLRNGLYLLKYTDKKIVLIRKFMVAH